MVVLGRSVARFSFASYYWYWSGIIVMIMEIILIHLDPKQDSRMHLSGSSSLCKMTINNVRPEDAGRLIIISIIDTTK